MDAEPCEHIRPRYVTQGIEKGPKQMSTEKKEENMFWLRATW